MWPGLWSIVMLRGRSQGIWAMACSDSLDLHLLSRVRFIQRSWEAERGASLMLILLVLMHLARICSFRLQV